MALPSETLSFYTFYVCHFIWPSSVKSSLSSICAELKTLWPDIHEIHKSYLVTKTLAGCMKLHGMASCTLEIWKTITHRSVSYKASSHPHISFTFPMQKANCFFEGFSIMLEQHAGLLPIFQDYLAPTTTFFSPFLSSGLNLTVISHGSSSTGSKLFPEEQALGHLLRSGGATALALAGVPLPLDWIQLIGWWSFLFYMCQNPVLLQSSITRHSGFEFELPNTWSWSF